MPNSLRRLAAAVAVASIAAAAHPAHAQATPLTPDQQLARRHFAQPIGINTTNSAGNTTVAAQAMAKRLLDAGFPAADVIVIGPRPKNQNLVVRLRGTGARKPLLLLAHLDVVEARRDDWSMDPFTLTERDGFFYGRGTSDIEDGAAIWVATLIRLKRENYRPDRDIILALTAGEESSSSTTTASSGCSPTTATSLMPSTVSTPTPATPRSRTASSLRVPSRPAKRSSRAIASRSTIQADTARSPPRTMRSIASPPPSVASPPSISPSISNQLTRNYFTRSAALEGGQLGADMRGVVATPIDSAAARRLSAVPLYNALLRTTCVATMLEAGHAENALPQTARATVNCRIFPTSRPATSSTPWSGSSPATRRSP